MAKSKKTKKANVQAELAKLQAEKKQEALVKREVAKVEKKAAVETHKLERELKIRKRAAGARIQAVSTMVLAICALVFAVIFVALFYVVQNNVGSLEPGSDASRSAQIAYIIFLCFMFASVIGLLVTVSPLWRTLRKEGHLTKVCQACIIIVWVFCAFALAVFLIDILTSAMFIVNGEGSGELVPVGDDQAITNGIRNLLNYIVLLSPAVLLVFSGVLYGSVKRSYPNV